MKNKILLAITLASSTFATQTLEISASSSAKEIAHATMEVAGAYIEIIEGVNAYFSEMSNDRAPLLKLITVAEILFPAIKNVAETKAKTDFVHEIIFNYKQNVEHELNAAIAYLKALVTSKDISDAQLREMLNPIISALFEKVQEKIAS